MHTYMCILIIILALESLDFGDGAKRHKPCINIAFDCFGQMSSLRAGVILLPSSTGQHVVFTII